MARWVRQVTDVENCGCGSKKLILLNHYLCSFNNSNHRVALFELQLVGTAPCDGALNEIGIR